MVFVLFKYLLTVKELFLFCHAIFVHSVLTEISLRFPGKSYLKISSSYEIEVKKKIQTIQIKHSSQIVI